MTSRYMVNHQKREVYIIAPETVENVYNILRLIRNDDITKSYYVFIINEPIHPAPEIIKPFAQA